MNTEALERMRISIIPYNDGKFEVLIYDIDTGEGLSPEGSATMTESELALINKLAPPCVWTDYQRIRV